MQSPEWVDGVNENELDSASLYTHYLQCTVAGERTAESLQTVKALLEMTVANSAAQRGHETSRQEEVCNELDHLHEGQRLPATQIECKVGLLQEA